MVLRRQMEQLSEVAVCRMFFQLSDAVQYIHQRGVVHCAITSHAVQLITADCAKLTNFEYARRQDRFLQAYSLSSSYHHADFFFLLPGTITLIYDYDYALSTPTMSVGVDRILESVCVSLCLSVCPSVCLFV